MDDTEPMTEQLFSADNISGFKRAFDEAHDDKSGGLHQEKFCRLMEKLYSSVGQEEQISVRRQIDESAEVSVHLVELVDCLLSKNDDL